VLYRVLIVSALNTQESSLHRQLRILGFSRAQCAVHGNRRQQWCHVWAIEVCGTTQDARWGFQVPCVHSTGIRQKNGHTNPAPSRVSKAPSLCRQIKVYTPLSFAARETWPPIRAPTGNSKAGSSRTRRSVSVRHLGGIPRQPSSLDRGPLSLDHDPLKLDHDPLHWILGMLHSTKVRDRWSRSAKRPCAVIPAPAPGPCSTIGLGEYL